MPSLLEEIVVVEVSRSGRCLFIFSRLLGLFLPTVGFSSQFFIAMNDEVYDSDILEILRFLLSKFASPYHWHFVVNP